MSLPPLAATLHSLLEARVARGRLALRLEEEDPQVFRWAPPAAAPPQAPVQAAYTLAPPQFQPIGRLSRLLDGLNQSISLQGGGVQGGPLLTLLAGQAGMYAQCLQAQMQNREQPVSGSAGRANGLSEGFASFQRDMRQTRQQAEALLQRVVQGMRVPPPSVKPRHVKVLELAAGPNGVEAAWLTGDGKPLAKELSADWLLRAAAGDETAFATQRLQVAALMLRHRHTGDTALKRLFPDLSEAVEAARANKKCVGRRVYSGQWQGLPVDLSVYVDPNLNGSGEISAQLVARRAHEEFVLENMRGELYYFPPIQLVARVEFVLSGRPWRLGYPEVRMPPKTWRWMHPYTGALGQDRFATALLIGPPEPEAMLEPSADARRLFPQLTASTAPAMCNNLCLNGQQVRISEVEQLLLACQRENRRPDLLSAVRQVWDLTRLGLTRGHQENVGAPRAELGSATMLYPVPRASLRGTSLLGRIYPYRCAAAAVV